MLLPRAHKGTQLCGGQLLVCQGPPDGVTKVLEMGKSRRKNIRSFLDYEIILLVSSTCIFFHFFHILNQSHQLQIYCPQYR